jgi:7-carboxy-7-deazaguanine synthase
VDAALIDALHAHRFEIAVETNGTVIAPPGLDWICVSPKAGASWVQRQGHELKLVYPQPDLLPGDVGAVADVDFEYRLLQPMDGPLQRQNTRAAIAYCQAHPEWRLSVQTHKVLDIR